MKKFSLIFLLALLLQISATTASAATNDLSIDPVSFRFSSDNYVEGKKQRIYATSRNSSSKDLYGIVKFFEGSKQIGADQPISVFAGKTDDVFVDWSPSQGEKNISIQLIPFEPSGDNKDNNFLEKKILILSDFDRDGTPDNTDTDDDNDNVADELDKFPKDNKESEDTDGDGIGNNADPDDDNDNTSDETDAFPKDPTESIDLDKDGIGDNTDQDDDNDGVFDGDEIAKGLNHSNPDTDGDKVIDGKDAFPLNIKEQYDTDHDKIGNNADKDDDNDGVPDTQDRFPTNLPAIIQEDGSLIVSPGKDIIFDASLSKDPDGKIKKITWKIGNEPEVEGLLVHHVFHETGAYKIQVSAMDTAGEVTSKSYTVYVGNRSKIFLFTIIGLLAALAIYFIIKYSRAASGRKNSNTSKARKH